jgi:SsrA-binding protein
MFAHYMYVPLRGAHGRSISPSAVRKIRSVGTSLHVWKNARRSKNTIISSQERVSKRTLRIMNQVRKADPNNKTVAENRKARFSYEVLDTIETGLVLTGTEVKSLRQGHANIQDSYASVEGGEIWLINSYLPEYLQANRFNHEPRRRRKLLLNKREMAKMAQSVDREGMTLVPLKIYFNDQGRAKLLLAVGRGKKLHDKRETEKQRDWSREKGRLLKERG